jgi:hypothetical protein
MLTRKRLLIGAVVTSGLYVGFAATVPNPEPGTPMTTRQKIAKYIKPRLVDKALDELHDKGVDLIMDALAKRFPGGPFGGGDEDATRDDVSFLTDPRQWNQAPIKIAVKVLRPSQTAPPIYDGPGADPATQSSRLPIQARAAQDAQHASDIKAVERAADLSAHPASKVPSLNDFLTDDEFESPAKPVQGNGGDAVSTSAKGERTAPPDAHSLPDHFHPDYPHSAPVPDRSEQVVSHGQQQTVAPGHQRIQPDLVQTWEGHYEVVSHGQQQTVAPGHQGVQPDLVQTSEGHYQVVSHETQAAPTPAAAAPAAAATPTPTVHESGHGDQGQSGGKANGGGGRWAGGDTKGPAMDKIASTASR